ncbi:MAG: hypothetical protein LBC88_02290 [Spirochaetaceae bacterium]|nr:hypothetical protein [Spirochaetaceae bacterium]
MNLSFAKKCMLLAMAASLVLVSCLNPIGLPSYGSTQGSTGGGDIAPGEGRLIIKNLTRDFAVNRVSFDPHSGQDSAPDLEPGPEKSNQRSVALPAGLWKVTAIYGPHGATTSINDVMVTEGNATTLYFYKTRTASGSLETQWLPPPDADLSGNANPGDVISEDEGFLHVINKSTLTYITGVEYNNGATWIQSAIPAPAGMSGNIAPGQASAPNLVLPRGNWAIRFRLLGKDLPSVAISRSILAGQTVDVEYTDSLITDRPPSGFGSLRIVNNLPDRPITRIVTRTQINNYEPEPLELSGSIAQDGGSQVRTLRAGDTPNSRRDYIVQCYVAANEYYEEVARIIDETITDVFITKDSPRTTEGGGGGGGSGAADGALTIYNRYAGQLPFKIFKIYLYREMSAASWDGYVPPGNPLYPQPPANGALHYNGSTAYTGDAYVEKQDYHTFGAIPEGAYKLLIVGGSYHWNFYSPGTAVPGTSIMVNEKRITYDCGNVFIAAGSAKVYNFDPYAQGAPDRDTPTGTVKITFFHAGTGQGQYGDAGPLARIQIIAGSESETADPAAHVYNVVQSNTTVNGPQASQVGVSSMTPQRFIVYDNNNGLLPGQKIEFLLPPGAYAVRVYNPAGNGTTASLWYGRDHSYYLDLHIKAEATRTVNLQWKWPHITIDSELLRNTTVPSTVTDIGLTSKKTTWLHPGADLSTFWANTPAWTQYEIESAQWYFFPWVDPAVHGQESDWAIASHYEVNWDVAPSGVRSGAQPWKLNAAWKLRSDQANGFDGSILLPGGENHGTTAQKGYYSCVLTLKPKTGYTFRGFTPSNDPPVGYNNVNHQGTGMRFDDNVASSTNMVGINNDYQNWYYRIRHMGFSSYQKWIITDGIIGNTGKLPGQDRIKVKFLFKFCH